MSGKADFKCRHVVIASGEHRVRRFFGRHERSPLRKRPNPALRQRLIHLPLGPACESLETAPIPWRSPVVSHFGEVDDTGTDARDRPGRAFRPVDVGAPTFDIGLSHRLVTISRAAADLTKRPVCRRAVAPRPRRRLSENRQAPGLCAACPTR